MESFLTPEKAPIRSVLKEINANGVVNKSPSSAKPSTFGFGSHVNDIDATLSPEHDTTIDTSYTVNNLTCSDLINGLDGLKIDTPVGKKLKANHHADANASSDDDMFQECENDLDETATAVHKKVDKTEASGHGNESFGFPSNMANSTASALNVSPNVSQVNNKSIALTPIVAESSAANFLSQQESIGSNSAVHSTSLRSYDANRTIESDSNEKDENETVDVETAGSTNVLNESVAGENLNTTIEVKKTLPRIVLETPGESNLNITVGSIDTNGLNKSVAGENLNTTIEVKKTLPQIILESPGGSNFNITVDSDEKNLVSNSTPDLNCNETIDLDSSESPNVTSTSEKPLNETVDSVTTGNLNETVELVNSTDASPGNYNLNGTIKLDTDAVSSPSSNLNATVELPAADSTTVDETSILPVESPLNHTIELTTNVVTPNSNVPSEKVTQLNTTTAGPESNYADETKTINTTFEPPTLEMQPVIKMRDSENMANDTFEAMDVDMNDTANFPPPPPEILSAANDQSILGNESLFNQTIDMQDCSEPAYDVPEAHKPANMNVTIDVSSTTRIQPPQVASPLQAPFRLMGNLLNKTQVLSDEPKNKVAELNKTIELETKLESNLNQTINLSKEPSHTNQTFVAGNNSPTNILNQTRNFDYYSSLPAARRPINANAPPSNPNMNETVVLDSNLSSANTTYISMEPSVSSTDMFTTPTQSDKPSAVKRDETFKMPQLPSGKVVNPFGVSNLASQAIFDITDDEFQSPGLILNSTDFDFLLSKGAPSSGQNNPRDSILERFDPISGRKSIINPPSLKSDATTTKLVARILEASIAESTSSDGNEPLLPIQDSDKIIDLNSSTTLDQNNSGDSDHSQASNTTETYETASIGDPLKTDVTMSVGLIHDSINMDNIKSMEQDMKEQPNLKMNVEQNVNKDMIEDVARKLKEAETREEALLRRITEKEKALNKMSAVVENYEKTMVEMLSEREQSKQKYEKELTQARAERDSNFHHLTSLESTFSDLHVKYEKSKQMALEVRENESKLKELCDFSREQMKLQEQRYEKLKNHALTQLEGANAKLEALNKAHSNEIKKLTAQMKKDEISRQSIMDQLAQKTKENEELVKICDELINNGGS